MSSHPILGYHFLTTKALSPIFSL